MNGALGKLKVDAFTVAGACIYSELTKYGNGAMAEACNTGRRVEDIKALHCARV